MDITKSTKKIFTTKYLNGETINYSAMFMVITFAFLILKQFLKLTFSVPSNIALIVSSVIALVALFFTEKRIVFNHHQSKKTIAQIVMYLLGSFVCFGFYYFFEFIFTNILKLEKQTVFIASFIAIFFFKYYFDRLLVFDVNTNAQNNKNGRLYKLFFDNRFIVLSLGLATVGIMFIYLIFQLFPFGDKTVLRMDLYHQYGPLFAELYDRITLHKSFIYSWESGGGSSFLGNYFNYLSSPLSILIFLFDRKQIAFAITTLVAVKGIISAGTFSYFIKKSLHSHSYASSAFGVFYAFCGYFLAYYWNIMWIDGMMLLPLVALGIERIINKGKPALYICSLCIMLFSSYYIGFMVCIFSILYFLVYFFANNSSSNISKDNSKKKAISKLLENKFINKGILFAGSSILCGALCACFLIPVFFILQQCSATSDSFPTLFESYFDLINLVSSHLAGIETTIRSSGDDVLPNIYCGILTVILVPLFVMNKEIRMKEKILYLALVAFFVFSFDNNYANFIWHALHFPNDLPYRFSFMYSFVMLIIAYKSLQKIKAIRYQDIAIVGIIWVLIVLYFQANPTNKISEPSIYISLVFVVIWTAVLLMIKKGYMTKAVIGITIVAMTFCEVIVANSNSYLFTQDNAPYVEKYDDYREAIENVHSKDDDFYRTELCYLMTRMDPCLYGYDGISTFSSMAYEKYSGTQYSLGLFGNRINSYTYNTQTPIYNMMFNIKYLMYRDEDIKPSKYYYSLFDSTENYNVETFKNDYYLPIAFETSNDVKDWIVEEGNPFDVQGDFIYNATGISDVFEEVEYTDCYGDGVDFDNITENGTYNYYKDTPDSDYGTVNITISPMHKGNVYVYITSPEIEYVNYTWGDEKSTNQSIDEPYIIDLGVHKANDEITVELDCSEETDGSYFEIYAYTVNDEALKSAYDLLKAGSINIEKYNDTTIEGTIDAGYNGLLYTSIPYDDGWSIYIDGEKQETFEIGDSMLASTIKEGKHTVKLHYSPKGINYGIVITVAGWLCVIAILTIRKIFSNKKENEIC